MEKPRLLLALVLSLAVLLSWQYFFAPPQEQKKQLEAKLPTNTSTEPITNSQILVQPQSIQEQEIVVETRLWKAVFSNKGGVVTKWILKELPGGKKLHSSDSKELNLVSKYALRNISTGLDTELGAPLQLKVPADQSLSHVLNTSLYSTNTTENYIFLKNGETRNLEFTFQSPDSGLLVKKVFSFQADDFTGKGFTFNYVVDAKRNNTPLEVSTVLGPNFGDQSAKGIDGYTHTPPQAVIISDKSHYIDVTSIKTDSPQTLSNATWGAITDHYFAMTFIPGEVSKNITLSSHKVPDIVSGKASDQEYLSAAITTANGAVNTLYIGPKDRNYLLPVNKQLNNRVDLEVLVNYGFFSFLVRPLIPLLDASMKLINSFTRNYGWAIIVITILVNTLLFPFKWKSSVAMKRTAKMQPKVKELQDRMKALKKGDPKLQEAQLEMAKLMKEGNPLMGCLPILVQLPVFWAFFIYLQLSIDIRQSPFIGWLSDLSAPDRLHVLPIVMCVTQVGSTLLMPSPPSNDPAQKFQKNLMTWVLPIVLTYFFFWSAPSGLVLYWMIGNVIGITQQLLINKLNPPEPPVSQITDENNGNLKKTKKSVSNLAVNESSS